MTWLQLFRSELRKLTTTKMPWAFVVVLVVLAGITAMAILFGTDADGSKAFIATAEDQQSLLAFSVNAMMGAGLFGAIAAAREYSHNTVVPTFLVAPRRYRTMLAQYAAIMVGGIVLAIVGGALIVTTGVITIPMADQEMLISFEVFSQLIAASALGGGIGAVLGAGIGALVRNTGGAVAAAVLVFIIAPPLIVQFTASAVDWIPATMLNVISGVGTGPGVAASIAGLVAWAVVPALIGMVAVQRRDVI